MKELEFYILAKDTIRDIEAVISNISVIEEKRKLVMEGVSKIISLDVNKEITSKTYMTLERYLKRFSSLYDKVFMMPVRKNTKRQQRVYSTLVTERARIVESYAYRRLNGDERKDYYLIINGLTNFLIEFFETNINTNLKGEN